MNGSSSYGMSSPVLASLAVFWYAGNPRSEPRRNLPGSPSSAILTSHVALDHDGSSAAAAAALLAAPRNFASNVPFSMTKRIRARATAASEPGMFGSHFHAFAAVRDIRGSTTTYFRRALASPSVMRRARRGGD